MGGEIATDGGTYGRKKRRFAKSGEKPESLQLVFDGILHLSHAQLDASRLQGFVELGQHVGGGHIHAGDRFRRDDQPAHRSRRCSHRVQHPVVEQLSVGEKQRRIPAKQDQAGNAARVGIARDVMITLDAVGASQDRAVRTPGIPQEFDDGNHNGQSDTWNRTQRSDPDCADDRQPEFPALDAIDSPQVGDLDQADGRCDHDRSQCAGRQILQQIRRNHQEQGYSQRADDSGHLGSGAGGLGHRGTRRTAANWKSLKESGGEVGGAEPDHFLVRVDINTSPRRIDARKHAGVSERDEGDGATADQDGNNIGGINPRDGERRQTLWEGAENRHSGACCKVQYASDDGRTDYGDQDARQALVALEQQDYREGACANHERRPVDFSTHYRCDDGP